MYKTLLNQYASSGYMCIGTYELHEFSKNQFVWREGNSKDDIYGKKKTHNIEWKFTVVQF